MSEKQHTDRSTPARDVPERRGAGSEHPGAGSEHLGASTERMWPLDLSIVVLAGLALYLVVTRLSFDDPRPLFNGRLYAVLIPVGALTIAIVLRGIASQYVQKSVQLGFLFSVTIHLLLLIIAFQWVIFRHYYPLAVQNESPERVPIRHEVSEHVFQTPPETTSTPDWARPVDAETASRVISVQPRELSPQRQPITPMEVPEPPVPEPVPTEKFIVPQATPVESLPKLADSPSRQARQTAELQRPEATQPAATAVPLSLATAADEANTERTIDAAKRSSRGTPSELSAPEAAPAAVNSIASRSAVERSMPATQPTLAEPSLARQPQRKIRFPASLPESSAPSIPSVAVARRDPDSMRVLSPVESPLVRQDRPSGAQISAPGAADPAAAQAIGTTSPGAASPMVDPTELARAEAGSQSPTVSVGSTASRTPTRRQPRQTFVPAGVPTAVDEVQSGRPGALAAQAAEIPQVADRSLDAPRKAATESANLVLGPAGPPDPTTTIPLPSGPTGLAIQPAAESGVQPLLEQPRLAAIDLNRDQRPRRRVGGPIAPAGAEVASAEAFNRRLLRTRGGAAPSPPGAVGPATEKSIELGLAFLANRQNDDGSWSLAGHGAPVILHSDTAATGLCMLAFQGAGYTHRQHQYAVTVKRGLQFLLDHQRTNGDLYVREDPQSDQNVALYSHGIAALAVCEAYGMTQDPELKAPAQASLDYIAATQHRQLGGWRYSPQISADTSVSGWMMMALKSGELAGLSVPDETYQGIDDWLDLARESSQRPDRYRYNPLAPDTATQRHGRESTPSMTAVGMLMRMYSGWRRDHPAMQSAANYLLEFPPRSGINDPRDRDTYYWYYATQVMFHMGGGYWQSWNGQLNTLLVEGQLKRGPNAGSWDPQYPVPDRWSVHAGRIYLTAMNLLNLEVYYRHLPIYEDTAD